MGSPKEIGFANCPGDGAVRHAEELVQRLNYLPDGDQTMAQIIACGPIAIPALKRFLFLGRPSVVYQPRRWAVEALAGLGAKDALLEYLTSKKNITDPAVRMGEEAVENAAARELAKWRTQDVRDALLGFAFLPPRTGIVEALGQFECPEAIPYFVHALEDDVCAAAAEQALRTLGRQAESALIAAARIPLPLPDEERPSSRRRRAKALELLAELQPSPKSWPLLKPLLAEEDAGIVTAASKIAAMLGNDEEKTAAVDRLLAVLPTADWFLRDEVQNCLLSLYKEGAARMDQEIAIRNALPEAERLADPLLRTLLSVRRHVEHESHLPRKSTQ